MWTDKLLVPDMYTVQLYCLTSSGAIWNDRPDGVDSVPLSPTSPLSDFFLGGTCGLGDVTTGIDDNVS